MSVSLETKAQVMPTDALPAATANLGRLLVRNTFSNFAGQFVLMGLTLFSTPYLIRHFGSARYGVLILLLTFVNMLTLFQFGINASLVKYVAEIFGQARDEEIKSYVGTALSLFSGVGIAVVLPLFGLGRRLVMGFVHVPTDLQNAAAMGVYLAAVAFLLRFVAEAFSAIPIAAQRFDIVNYLFVGSEVIRIVGSVAVVYFGFLLETVLTVILLANLAFLVANIIAAKRLIPGLSMLPRFSQEAFGKLWHFSKFSGLNQFASRVGNSLDGVIVAHFLPVAYVAFYSVPSALCYKIWALVGNVTAVTFPTASALSRIGHHDRLRELYLRSGKMVAALAALPALALFLLSREVLLHWIGPEFAEQGALTLRLLSVGFLINCLMHIPDTISQGMGHPQVAAKFNVLHLVLNVSLLLILVPNFGIVGAALGYLCSQLVLAPWFVSTTNKLVGLRWMDVLQKSYGVVLAPVLGASFVVRLLRPHISSFLSLTLVAAAGLVVYLGLGTFLILDSKERSACFALLTKRPSSQPTEEH